MLTVRDPCNAMDYIRIDTVPLPSEVMYQLASENFSFTHEPFKPVTEMCGPITYLVSSDGATIDATTKPISY